VTGVGHEPDFSLADAAADYSASTPTAAAEAVVPDTDQLRQELRYRHTQLLEWMAGTLMHWEQRFDLASTALIDLQTRWIETLDQNLAYTGERMGTLVQHRMQTLEQHLVRAASELDAFSPLSTLGRGYSIAQQADGTVISSIKQVKPQDRLQIHVTDGVMDCEVRDVHEKRP
jgi:exodeoxyribonuclease VII large subunit